MRAWILVACVALLGAEACGGDESAHGLDAGVADAPSNHAPMANITPVGPVRRGEPVTLSGEASSDPDGDPLTYGWRLTATAGGSAASLGAADAATLTFTPDVSGVYSVELTVSDPGGLSDTATVELTATARVAVVGDDYGDLETPLRDAGYLVDEFPSDPWSRPPIVSGARVVWLDRSTGVREIRLLDTESGVESVVAGPSDDLYAVAMDGDLIAWFQWSESTGAGDLHAYRISTGESRALTSDGMADRTGGELQINGDRIAYSDRRDDPLGEVYVYDLAADTDTRITSSPGQELETRLSADVVFWRAAAGFARTHIHGYRFADGSSFEVSPGGVDQAVVDLDGDWLAWVDILDGTRSTIFAYQLSTGALVQPTSSTAAWGPIVGGGRVAYTDAAGVTTTGERNVHVYDLATGSDTALTVTPGPYQVSFVTADLVAWSGRPSAPAPPTLTVHRVSTGEEWTMEFHGNDTPRPSAESDTVAWADSSAAAVSRGFWFRDVWLSTDGGRTSTDITPDKTTLDDADAARYDAIVFGPHQIPLAPGASIDLFDEAVAAGTAVLGLGTDEGGTPLVVTLAADGRLGLTPDSDCGHDPMEIDVTPEGAMDPIFDGIDTGMTLTLSGPGGEGDEERVSVDTSDPMAPADYQVLASFGPGMHFDTEPAIVSFTAGDARVILDGSALSHDEYALWNDLRWDLYVREVRALAGPSAPPP